MESQTIDIAQIAFLDMIREMISLAGAPAVKGTLIRIASKAGRNLAAVSFANFDEFLASVELGTNPIAITEGVSKYYGSGLFGLPRCPFAPAIRGYTTQFGTLPDSYAFVTTEYNKPAASTAGLRVGHGAGVGPFCAVHQPMRAAAASRVTICGQSLEVHQLGCKSAQGTVGLASRWIAEGGWSEGDVRRILSENMCCYGVKLGGELPASSA